TLVIMPLTQEVRLELRLRELDATRYRARLRPVGGADLPDLDDLVPLSAPGGPGFVLVVQASRFLPGDYLLTLQGASGDGGFEDLSQTIFRVEKP
ncbi:MAG TPA: hypothetical protein VJV75_12475, partial [Candidatus Polarisedimenticolia bacterium]|nr:hypothetical protein [Candidatus Polarisedimenticolia bacterium]